MVRRVNDGGRGPFDYAFTALLVALGTIFSILAVSLTFHKAETVQKFEFRRFGRSAASRVAAAEPLANRTAVLVDNDWESAATSNLTSFRASMLQRLYPHHSKREYWEHFPPIITCPPDRPLVRYGGEGDGSKLLCKRPINLVAGKTCIIYSLGSNGDYSFEHAMLKESDCEIHTFDCTYKGKSQQKGRHFYHRWCVGDPKNGRHFRTWAQITKALHHDKVDLLKMDIEGHEYSVLATFRAEDQLPDELSMEMHASASAAWPTTTVELGLTFMHLANLGYALYAQEVNPIGKGCCCEVTFMRLPVRQVEHR